MTIGAISYYFYSFSFNNYNKFSLQNNQNFRIYFNLSLFYYFSGYLVLLVG